jgi:hypothetical protein
LSTIISSVWILSDLLTHGHLWILCRPYWLRPRFPGIPLIYDFDFMENFTLRVYLLFSMQRLTTYDQQPSRLSILASYHSVRCYALSLVFISNYLSLIITKSCKYWHGISCHNIEPWISIDINDWWCLFMESIYRIFKITRYCWNTLPITV